MYIYGKFASIYDELMDDFDYEAWFNYIEKIWEKTKKPKNVLEMACGTGNLSYYIARNAYNLDCFDISDEMLSKAYNKMAEYKNVNIFNQDMIKFNLHKKYDSIVAICDSINYIIDDEDLLRTFKNVYDHLEDDGVFIFDINSYYKLKDIIGNNTFVEDREDVFYIWENYFDEDTRICDFYLTFFFLEEDGNYERFNEDHMERAYRVREVVDLLKKAGFNNIEYYEAFSFNEVHNQTERINFVVKK